MRTFAPLLVLCGMAGLAMLAVGCDPGHGVTYHNETNERLSVYRFGGYAFTLQPFEKATYGVLEFPGSMTIEARDDKGNVVYSKAFTWEQLRQMNWEVAISDTSQVPRAGPTAWPPPP